MTRFGCVLINYRFPEDTLACLASLRETGSPDFKIILVNNHASDGSALPLRQGLAETGLESVYLEPGSNLGFAGGCNLGIHEAMKDAGLSHVLILNNDAKVADDFGAEIVKAASAHPGEIIAGTVLDSLTGKPSFNIGRFTALTGQIRHLFGEGPHADIDFVSGCLMVVPAEVFRSVGFFEEDYFMYWEDADFCMRIRERGIRIRHWPALKVVHALSSTTSRTGTSKEYYRIRNQTHLILHRGRLHQKALYLMYLAALLVHRLVLRPGDFRQSVRGAADGLRARLGRASA